MPERAQYGTRPEITVDGAALTESLLPALVRTIVDAQIHLPDMFVLQFLDTQRDVIPRAHIRFGSRIEIATTRAGDETMTPVITGEVTAMEQETDSTGTWTIVRGYDASHRLCRGRQTRTFTDTTDADLVRQVAGAAGVELGTVVDDGPTYEHVSQANLSDWDFLRSRANQTGHEVAVVNGKLQWRIPNASSQAPAESDDLFGSRQPLQLLLGRELTRFKPRVTAAEQVSEVQVRGWDPQQKRAVVGSASSAATSASVGISPAQLASGFAARPYVVVDRPVTSQGEADALAGVVASQIASAHTEAEGTAHGDPSLKPGVAISIGNVGWPHDGKYVLSSARHVYDETGYRTEFTVTGGQERSLLGLTSVGATKGSPRASGPPIQGLVIGQVTDVNDPESQFRVKVSFPWLSAEYESWWCRVVQLGAGKNRGMVWLPEVGDEVLVGFEHGDVAVPYVVGGLYNGVDLPPLADQLVDRASGEVKLRALVSRTNHRLVLSDDSSTSHVLLSTGDDNLTITLDQSQMAIAIDASGKVTIHGSQGVCIKSDADVSIEAGGRLSLSGQGGVKVDGGPSVEMSGAIIKLN